MKFMPLSTILRKPAKQEHIVDGLFPEGSLNIVFGSPSSMKSFFLADMLCAVVSGSRWLASDGFEGYAVKQCPAMWVDYDNGKVLTHERFYLLGSHYDINPAHPLYISSDFEPENWLNAGKIESMNQFENTIESLGVKLVVIDNLGVIHAGFDENSNSDMSIVMANLRRCAERTGCCIVLIHHKTKGDGYARAGDSSRGGGAIEAALSLSLLISRKDIIDTKIKIRPTKIRGKSSASLLEARLVADDESAHFELLNAKDVAQKSEADEKLRQQILMFISDNPGVNRKSTENSISESASTTVFYVRKEIDAMIKDRELTVSKGARNASLLFLSETSEEE